MPRALITAYSDPLIVFESHTALIMMHWGLFSIKMMRQEADKSDLPYYNIILWYRFCEFHCIFGAESSSDDRLYIFSDECFIINMGRKHNPLLENRLFRFGGE